VGLAEGEAERLAERPVPERRVELRARVTFRPWRKPAAAEPGPATSSLTPSVTRSPAAITCGGDPGGETEAGFDVVVCAGGPMIVDVNAFPGFNGVPGR
jgi:hypothetical protein